MLRKIFRRSDSTNLLALALAVGLTTGIGIWLFRSGIELFHNLFDERLAGDVLGPILGKWAIIPVLAFAGFIVGWMMDRFVGHEPYHGLAGIIESVALTGGRLRYAVMPIKALASALSLGAGASVGPEAPSVTIGANIGSFLSHRLRLPEERSRLLVAAGSAAAIAAVFRAPISGVFFALEVILNSEFNTGAFGVVVLAAVTGSAFLQAVEGGTPEYGLLNFTFGSPVELIYYGLLGLILAPISVAFIRMVEWQHDFWHKHIHLSRPWKVALTGVIVGAAGVFLPQALGAGREAITAVLQGEHFALELLLVLAAAKLIMTAISIGGGFVGGIFAPTLFIGAMVGGAFGQIITGGAATGHEAFAIAGMAAVMAGVVRAPITGILLAFELTNDYRLVMPIMLTTVICVYLTERLVPGGLDAMALMGAGVHLPKGRDVDVMQSITIDEVMETPPPTILASASLTELRDTLRKKHTRALCVLDEKEHLSGIVTLTDLQTAFDSANGSTPQTVKDICTRDVTTVSPNEALWVGIRCMSANHIGQVPVVEERSGELIGLLTRSDVMDAYQTAIARKMKTQQRVQQIRLNALTGAKVIELHVASNATIVSKRIREVAWPKDSVIASVQRHDKLILPHGDTQIQAQDTLTFVAEPGVEDELAALCGYEMAAPKNGKH